MQDCEAFFSLGPFCFQMVGGVIDYLPARSEGIIASVTLIGPRDAYVTTLQDGKQTVWSITLSVRSNINIVLNWFEELKVTGAG